MMRMMGMQGGSQMMEKQTDEMSKDMGMGSSMEDMMDSMTGKTGDEFDRAFMSSMAIHHQGAIDMAMEAEKYAKHDEIKAMARDIIDAQTREMNQMKMWQTQWGY